MRLDIYQAETARIAQEKSALLDEARHRLLSPNPKQVESKDVK